MPTTTEHHARGTATADDDLAFAGLTRLSELLSRGQVTPRELAEFYLARIERIDPMLGAFISVRAERALTEADAALERLHAGERGPLLGIPIAREGQRRPRRRGDDSRQRWQPRAGARRIPRSCAGSARRARSCSARPRCASWRPGGISRAPTRSGSRATRGSSTAARAARAAAAPPRSRRDWSRSRSDQTAAARSGFPSAFCGLFGLKPQRGRIPLAPLGDHWYGCTVLGGLGRSVLDVALFDDAISGPLPGAGAEPPEAERPFAAAARREPGRLRIAVSLKPAIPGVKPSRESIAAVEQTAELLRSLGHEVDEYKLAHPQLLTTFTPRWAAGVRDEALAQGAGLERRTDGWRRSVGGWVAGHCGAASSASHSSPRA